MEKKAYLVFVEANGINSNKYYNMFLNGDVINVEYGRIGSTKTLKTYHSSKWNSIYNEKTNKGYKDISELKSSVNIIIKESNNKDFNEFFDVFSKYTGNHVARNYSVDKATKAQVDECQLLLNQLSDDISLEDVNYLLLEIFKIIPRKMGNVRDFMLKDLRNKNHLIQREQDSLDSIDSINSIQSENPFEDLNIEFREIAPNKEIIELYNNGNTGRYKIYKCYEILDKTNFDDFNNLLSKQDNKQTQLLIHGTRNPNVFNILKSGLLIRPSNTAMISGAAYGNGIYHSLHTNKSLNYTGYDTDKIFFIQNVHMGVPYTYEGWYRDGKGLNRSEMNYNDLKKKGYDSLYVKPGDGLLNSEYIVYNKNQTITNYLLWLK